MLYNYTVLPIPPSWMISSLFLLSAILAGVSGYRYKDWTGNLFAPVLALFSFLYFTYALNTVPLDPEAVVRQFQVRTGLVILGLAFLFWRGVSLYFQVKAKKNVHG